MKVGIIGLGLIGGSLGRAICKKTSHTVYAIDCDEKTMLKAKMLNAFHEELTLDNANEIDMLIIALYPNAIIKTLKEYVPLLKQDAIVIDCGGNKREIVAVMRDMAKEYSVYFMGGHPMAGREFSGISHSTAGLFDNATMIAVPINLPIDVLVQVKEFFLALDFDGMVISTAEEHDEIISYTSQLAHIVSSSYIKNDLATTHYGFSAGSFRDMTRVAKLNPEMWTELMLGNKDYLSGQLQVLIGNLTAFKKAIEKEDSKMLCELLTQGKLIKESVDSLKDKKRDMRLHK